jgi:hypothetical protein
LDASGFSCDIAEKSRVNDEAETDGTLPDEPEVGLELPEVGVLPLLLHAASATPAVMAAADVQLILVNRFKQITSTVGDAAVGGATLRPSARESLRPQLLTETINPAELTCS